MVHEVEGGVSMCACAAFVWTNSRALLVAILACTSEDYERTVVISENQWLLARSWSLCCDYPMKQDLTEVSISISERH